MKVTLFYFFFNDKISLVYLVKVIEKYYLIHVVKKKNSVNLKNSSVSYITNSNYLNILFTIDYRNQLLVTNSSFEKAYIHEVHYEEGKYINYKFCSITVTPKSLST